jgi:hypothetical protein
VLLGRREGEGGKVAAAAKGGGGGRPGMVAVAAVGRRERT